MKYVLVQEFGISRLYSTSSEDLKTFLNGLRVFMGLDPLDKPNDLIDWGLQTAAHNLEVLEKFELLEVNT